MSEERFILSLEDKKQSQEIELLFSARKIPYYRFSFGDSYCLEIPLKYKKFAILEIEKFYRENEDWPQIRPKGSSSFFKASSTHLFILLALVLFHGKVHRSVASKVWFERGIFSAEKILDGEYPRIITSLSLHLDDAHLLSNIFGLALFGSGVNYFLGSGISILAILSAAALGNYGNALFYQVHHQAAGASTAVFAALGLTAALRIKDYVNTPYNGKKHFIPLIAALGIFALMGTSLQSDVMAHFLGFISGILIGALCLPLLQKKILSNNWVQSCAFVFSIYIVAGSWWLQMKGFSFP